MNTKSNYTPKYGSEEALYLGMLGRVGRGCLGPGWDSLSTATQAAKAAAEDASWQDTDKGAQMRRWILRWIQMGSPKFRCKQNDSMIDMTHGYL